VSESVTVSAEALLDEGKADVVRWWKTPASPSCR